MNQRVKEYQTDTQWTRTRWYMLEMPGSSKRKVASQEVKKAFGKAYSWLQWSVNNLVTFAENLDAVRYRTS